MCSCLPQNLCLPQVVLYYGEHSPWTSEEQEDCPQHPQREVAPGVEVIGRLSTEYFAFREPGPWSSLSSAAQRAFASLDLGPYEP